MMLPPPDVEHRRDAVPAAAGDAGDVDVEHRRPRRRRWCWSGRRRRRGRCRRCCRARAARRTSRRRERHRGADAVVVARRRAATNDGLAAGRADGVDRVGAVGDVGDHHLGALASEQLGGDPPEPAAAPVISATLSSSRPGRSVTVPPSAPRMVWFWTLGHETLGLGNGYGKLRSHDGQDQARRRRADRHDHERQSGQAQRVRRRDGRRAVRDPGRAADATGRARGDLAGRGQELVVGA